MYWSSGPSRIDVSAFGQNIDRVDSLICAPEQAFWTAERLVCD